MEIIKEILKKEYRIGYLSDKERKLFKGVDVNDPVIAKFNWHEFYPVVDDDDKIINIFCIRQIIPLEESGEIEYNDYQDCYHYC